MEQMIDSSIWIDHFRPSTSTKLKNLTHEIITHPEAVVCKPIVFELLRSAHQKERYHVEQLLSVIPIAPTPKLLWEKAVDYIKRPDF